MADGKTFVSSFSVTKGGATISTGQLSSTETMTGTDLGTNTQAIGTSNEVLNVPADIGQPIDIQIKNLDATNYVEIFRDNADAQLISKLPPGADCKLRSLNVIPFGKANTAAVQIQWWACEA